MIPFLLSKKLTFFYVSGAGFGLLHNCFDCYIMVAFAGMAVTCELEIRI